MKVAVVNGDQFLLTPRITVDAGVADHQSKSPKQALRQLGAVVGELRQEANQAGLHKMPKREIDAAVTAARRDLKKTAKRPAK